MVIVPLNTRFAVSHPFDDDRCLRTIKIQSLTSFGGKGKPLAPCRKILRHVKNPCGIWQILRRLN
jgi:hypothetical protein